MGFLDGARGKEPACQCQRLNRCGFCNMLLICNYLTTARVRALCVGKTEKHHCPLGNKDKPRAARPLETASPKKKSR